MHKKVSRVQKSEEKRLCSQEKVGRFIDTIRENWTVEINPTHTPNTLLQSIQGRNS